MICINCAKFISGMLREDERIRLEACQNCWWYWNWDRIVTGTFSFNIDSCVHFLDNFGNSFLLLFYSLLAWVYLVHCSGSSNKAAAWGLYNAFLQSRWWKNEMFDFETPFRLQAAIRNTRPHYNILITISPSPFFYEE